MGLHGLPARPGVALLDVSGDLGVQLLSQREFSILFALRFIGLGGKYSMF
jgi:hypothetical protein